MDLGNQRNLFEIPEDIAYLNCAYMGPQLRSVQEVGEWSVARKSRPWEITPPDFFGDAEKARSLFASLVGGDADGVAIIPAVSYGISVAAANIPVREGENILILEGQFPSNVHTWRELAKKKDANVVIVPRPADLDWTASILEHLDESVAVAAIPNCHWTDGSLVDLKRVGERAREVGAALVVDGIQSIGAQPFDVAQVRPDFLVASTYKWMLGPYSLGFMWVDERWREGAPLEHNWITRSGSEDFSRLVDYRDDFAPGARRYDVGERSNFVLLPMAIAALEQILEWGVENISETTGRLTDLIEKEARVRGIEAVPADQRSPHMIGLRLGSNAPDDLAARLAGRNVFVSVRGDSVRVSPHVYNNESDVERLFAALDSEIS